MAYDFKKEQKKFYNPPTTPEIINIPTMNFIAVRGNGDPGDENGEYQKAISLLYPVAYALRMGGKGAHPMDGYFEYVVPPLEGFWWQEGIKGVDYSKKDKFCWISMLRLPDFIQEEDVKWAIQSTSNKKGEDYSKVEFFTHEEGTCVQCMHLGPFATEPETTKKMEEYAIEQGLHIDICDIRYHHEIYLSDFRKTAPEKLKTILRHPVS